ncbi:MAG TPA: adenylosuccinate lyase [Longimicrobiales bacterium]|nr:adenylosuccinate lyase [Longimicrobiales bacterium]
MVGAESFTHPLTDRYASEEMSRIFSPATRVRTWRRLWIALAEAQRELGLPIPAQALDEMRSAVKDIDLGRAAELESELRHDVMAHVRLYGEDAPAAAGWIHAGATSCFVTDNADLILQREALGLVRSRLLACVARLADFARKHRATPALGFTHFQPAQPTTVGKRATLWLQDLLLDLEEVDHRLSTFRFRGVRGATGTQASFLELFAGDAGKVDRLDEAVARAFGFERRFAVTGQTYPRKADYAVVASLAGIAASASKFANDVRLLQHLREVEEPFTDAQVGSSAMPYKRNPMRSERINALARHAIVLSLDPAMTAATQWLERTLDDSANRRIAIPEAFLCVDAILLLLHQVAAGLRVNRAVIRERLARELPFVATEAILMRSVRAGGNRQELHEVIRRHAVAAAERASETGAEPDLVERLSADPAIGLGEGAIRDALRPELHVGRAPEQVDAFLAAEVEPLLEGSDWGPIPEPAV